jgi:hypothetical protein
MVVIEGIAESYKKIIKGMSIFYKQHSNVLSLNFRKKGLSHLEKLLAEHIPKIFVTEQENNKNPRVIYMIIDGEDHTFLEYPHKITREEMYKISSEAVEEHHENPKENYVLDSVINALKGLGLKEIKDHEYDFSDLSRISIYFSDGGTLI